MDKLSYTKGLKIAGISYLGNVKQSSKMMYSFNAGTLTYCIYLAPWNLSGRQVCPGGRHCHEHCLNGAGRTKLEILSKGESGSPIINARIKKTNLLFDNRELFMQLLIHEIKKAMKLAERLGLDFSVRINGTSDVSPEFFVLDGKNILEIFPMVQFYDYTKVPSRINLLNKYPNYDLTFSFDGYNWDNCKEFLNQGGKVAVVFDGCLPSTYMGFNVIDANGYDMRYIDPASTICGLNYHRTANDYKSGKYVKPDTKFVVNTAIA